MSTKASVSVIIPCYNSSNTITRAVKSVISQTVLPLEIILIDDASQDNTLEILYAIQAEQGEDWIKVIPFTENRGPSAARNAGWEQAKAEYIAFLDADDSWHPQKVEIQYGWMQKNPSIVLTGHQIRLADLNFLIATYSQDQIAVKQVKRGALLFKNLFTTSTVMIRESLSLRFDENQSFCEDYLLWLKIFLLYGDAYLINFPAAFRYKFAYGEAGLSSNLWLMEKGELQTYKKIFKAGELGLLQLILLSTWSVLRYTKRIVISKLWSS